MLRVTFRSISGTRASQHLDLIRGAAALAVLIYHVRYRFFLDWSDLESPGALAAGWYVLTSFGHDAVMVFFVLSGFLIGSAVVRNLRTDRWNWVEYLASRGVRLYVVLIPGILLTILWDQIGLHMFGGSAVYTGAPQPYGHDYFDVAARSGVGTLAGNLLFLQQILCAPFGSNGALWSLSFEFWYYVIFPLGAVAVLARGSWRHRGAAAAACLGILFWLARRTIVAYFPLWLLGVVIGFLPLSPVVARRPGVWAWLVTSLFVPVVALTHVSGVRALLGESLLATDAVTALSFAVCLYVILHDHRPAAGNIYGAISQRLASCSYTLYVTHLPVLVFLRAWLVTARPWTPTTSSLAAAMLIASVVFGYSFLVASLTESHTSAVRQWVLDRMTRSRPAGLRR